MRRIFTYIVLALSGIFFTGCIGNSVDQAFLYYEGNTVHVNGAPQFSWDEKTCQMSFSRDAKEFRVFTDTMSDYYSIKMSEIPSSQGQSISCDLTWTTSDDVITKKGVTFKVEQIDVDGKVWLWNRKEKIGVIVQIID